MEEQIKALDDFIDTYVLVTSIKKVSYVNKGDSSYWHIEYNRDLADDSFSSTYDMIEFLHIDQYSE